MNVATKVFKRYLKSNGFKRKIWSFLRNVLIKIQNDPTCSVRIHGRRLKIPLSSALPIKIKKDRFYDRLPGRISNYIHQKQKSLICIDVGANIGDSIAAFYKDDTDTFLAVEPNPKYNHLLRENWGTHKNVDIISAICSSTSRDDTVVIIEKEGSSQIHRADNGNKMHRKKLDDIVKDIPSVKNANVVKIDTDGHDFDVIAGSKEILSRNHPMVLFECDHFENTKYVEQCLETLKLFHQVGYNNFLVYDNYGNLMGRYSLVDPSPFRNLIFYHLTSRFHYFDILVIKDEDISDFFNAEIDYFIEHMPHKIHQKTAYATVEYQY